MAGVATPSCAAHRAGCGCGEHEGRALHPHPVTDLTAPRTPTPMLWSSRTPAKGKNARSPTLGSSCQPGHPTHLGSEVLPTNSVLGAVGVILVPPVQVQLCGTVAGWQAPDVHARGQLQLHCGERRGDLQSQVGSTCSGPIQGPGGYSKAETRETQPAGQEPGLCP